MLRSLTNGMKWTDYFIHLGVSVLLVILNFIYVNGDHYNMSHIPSTLASGSLGLLIAQGVYHLVLMIQVIMFPEAEESDTGKALRNTITSVALIISTVALAHEGSSNGLLLTSVILLGAMRVLDSILDAGNFSGALTVQCVEAEDFDNEKQIRCIGAWGGRALIVHGLMASAGALALINRLDLENEKNAEVSDMTWSIYLISLILLAVHLSLHPIVLLFKLCGLDKPIMSACRCALCCGGEQRYSQLDNCDKEELVSLSRIPLVRQIVAGLILIGLSYTLGALYTLQHVRLLIAALGLYLGADIVGRNYI